jgi:hypothetical protein
MNILTPDKEQNHITEIQLSGVGGVASNTMLFMLRCEISGFHSNEDSGLGLLACGRIPML